jgi:IMP dehydrogenase
MINYVESLAFDDLMLVPKYSEVGSRSDVNLSVDLGKGIKISAPFVPSNMKTITELAMAQLAYEQKGLAIFHRFAEFSSQLEWLETIKTWGEDAVNHIGFSVGVKSEHYEQVDKLVAGGAKILCIDIAHGHSAHCFEMTSYISSNYPHVLLISGNVADAAGARRLWERGADIVKVGIGAGSICLTRINTGNGVPSMTSLADCADERKYMEVRLGRKLFIMNDGGCKTPGDVAKALCFADLCMIGNLFSATDEAPGEIIEIDGIQYKSYVGSSTHRGVHKEGVEGYKRYKGSARKVFQDIAEGIKSCCSYQGVTNLEDLKRDPKFVKISSAGLKESHAHDLDIIVR